jgi:hypothetical protein
MAICVQASCVLLLVGRINPIMLPYTVHLSDDITGQLPEEVKQVHLTIKPKGEVRISMNDVPVTTVILTPESVTNSLYLVAKYGVSMLEVTDFQRKLINFTIEYGPFRTGVKIFLWYLQWTPFGLDLKIPTNP